MNEIELLTRLRAGIPAEPGSQRAEDLLLAAIRDETAPPAGKPSVRRRLAGPPGRPRTRRLVIAAGLSLALAGGLLAAEIIPVSGSHGAPAADATVLQVTEHAAASARAQPALAPHQWVYLKLMFSYPPPPTAGYQVAWQTADGVWGWQGPHGKPFNFSSAVCDQDKQAGLAPICSITYQSLNSLPKAPAALITYLENLYKSSPASQRPADAFATINVLFNKFVMPPAILAEMYKALALIPGVTVVPGAIDLAGQHAVGLRYPGPVPLLGTNGEILLNPRTYLYVGSQNLYGPKVATYHNRHVGGTLYLRVVPVSGPGQTP